MAQFDLSPKGIAGLCEAAEAHFTKCGIARKETLRMTLMAEEVLLRYAEAFGADTVVELNTGRFFRRVKVQLVVHCGSMNPFADEEEGILNSLMTNCSAKSTEWRYERGANCVVLSALPEEKLNNLWRIFLALVLGVPLGFFLQYVMGSAAYEALMTDYFKPLAEAYTGILCVMAILLIFFTFPLGVVQLGSTASFHKLTRRILLAFALLPVGFLAVYALAALPGLRIYSGSAAQASVVKSGFKILLGFLPNGLISPFLNFNCMQVLVVGLMFGFSFLAMGEKSKGLVNAFDKCNYVAVLTNNYLTKFIPLYVFLMATAMAGTSAREFVPALLRIAPATILCGAILLLGFTAAVCIRFRVSPVLLWKKFGSAFLINLSSASVGASFITLYNELAEGCGVELSYTGICCNLGTVLFKPLYALFLAISAVAMAELSGISVSAVWIILVLLLSLLLSAAIPNIQSGAVSVILLLFNQLGFRGNASGAVISVNALLQFLIVPVNVFCLQCLTLLLSAGEGKLDTEQLLRKTARKK